MNWNAFCKVLMAVVLEAAAQELPTAKAGLVPCPGDSEERVAPGTTDVFYLTFYGGEWAEIRVDGNGRTDLDLVVKNDRGHVVVMDDDASDLCLVFFYVARTQTYRVEVRNLGSVSNKYEISTN